MYFKQVTRCLLGINPSYFHFLLVAFASEPEDCFAQCLIVLRELLVRIRLT